MELSKSVPSRNRVTPSIKSTACPLLIWRRSINEAGRGGICAVHCVPHLGSSTSCIELQPTRFKFMNTLRTLLRHRRSGVSPKLKSHCPEANPEVEYCRWLALGEPAFSFAGNYSCAGITLQVRTCTQSSWFWFQQSSPTCPRPRPFPGRRAPCYAYNTLPTLFAAARKEVRFDNPGHGLFPGSPRGINGL
jgi:hypothetical protein